MDINQYVRRGMRMRRALPRNRRIYPGLVVIPGVSQLIARLFPLTMCVAAGEDIRSRIAAMSRGRGTMAISAATGSMSTIAIAGAPGLVPITHEGDFTIQTLTGVYMHHDINDGNPPVGCLSIMFTNPEGDVFGGFVQGPMIAASLVRVMVLCVRD